MTNAELIAIDPLADLPGETLIHEATVLAAMSDEERAVYESGKVHGALWAAMLPPEGRPVSPQLAAYVTTLSPPPDGVVDLTADDVQALFDASVYRTTTTDE